MKWKAMLMLVLMIPIAISIEIGDLEDICHKNDILKVDSHKEWACYGSGNYSTIGGDNIWTGSNTFNGGVTFNGNVTLSINLTSANVNNSQYLNSHPDTYFYQASNPAGYTTNDSCLAFVNASGYIKDWNASGFITNQSQNLSGYCTATNGLCTPIVTTYYPNTTATTGGTNTTSNITLMWYYDSKTYNITEGNGVNPLDLYVNFTNVTNFSEFYIREYYLGSTSHDIEVDLWDYVSASWQSYYQFTGQSGYNIIAAPVFDAVDHTNITDSYKVQMRLHHVQTGVSSHQLFIDFIFLQNGNSIVASSNLDGFAKYQFAGNNFNGSGNFVTTGNISSAPIVIQLQNYPITTKGLKVMNGTTELFSLQSSTTTNICSLIICRVGKTSQEYGPCGKLSIY